MDLLGMNDCVANDIGDIKLGGVSHTIDTPPNTKKIVINLPDESTRLKEMNRLLVIEQEKNQELEAENNNDKTSISILEFNLNELRDINHVYQKSLKENADLKELINDLEDEIKAIAHQKSQGVKEWSKKYDELKEENTKLKRCNKDTFKNALGELLDMNDIESKNVRLTSELKEEKHLSDLKTVKINELTAQLSEHKKLLSRINDLVI